MNMKQTGADQFYLDVRIKKDGRQYRQRETFHGCRKNAERRYWALKEELQTAAENGQRSFSDTTTFKHIIDYYLDRNPVDADSECYFNKLKEDLGNVPISDMRERFDKYLLLLKKTQGQRYLPSSKTMQSTGILLSNQTINHYLKWAKAAFNCAVRAGITEQNPLQYFQKLQTRPRDRMLTEEEKKNLLEVVKNEAPHIYPIVLYSTYVPCRRGELLALRRTDYNMVTNTIHVPAEMTKMKRACIKPVPECCTEYFRSVPKECSYLFYRRKGKRYYPLGDFKKAWKRCLKLAGIENYRFHDQRRGAYTDLLLKGNTPHTVMQISGHATDMSKVYFGRNEMLAAKSINFGEKGTLRGTLESSENMQTAMM
jgi:integrase